MSAIFRLLLPLSVLFSISACQPPPENVLPEGPAGYVEFYIPLDDPGAPDPGTDASVYRLDGEEREFKGMTRKWEKLAAPKRGLLVTETPGDHVFDVQLGSASKSVEVSVEDGVYHPVRISLSEVADGAAAGILTIRRFRMDVAVEDPVRPRTQDEESLTE